MTAQPVQRILIAEDNHILRTFLADHLTRAGFEVAMAADGVEAWECIRAAPPDLLICDLIMPGLDGFHLCRLLRHNPRSATLPIIILSGATAEAEAALATLGVHACVAKRSGAETIDALLAAIRTVGRGDRPPPSAGGEPTSPLQPRQVVVELLAQTAHLHAMLAHLGEGVLALDTSGRVVFANPAAVRLLGQSEYVLVGQRLVCVLDGEGAQVIEEALLALKSTPPGASIERQVPHAGRFFNLTATQLLEADGASRSLLLLRDGTHLVQRIRDLTMINECARVLASTQDIDGALERILVRITTSLGAAAGFLALEDEATGELVVRRAVGPDAAVVDGRRIWPGQGIAGWAFRTGQAVHVVSAADDPRFSTGIDAWSGVQPGAVLCAPLAGRSTPIGVVQLAKNEGAGPFHPEDLALLSALANHAAIALENARLFGAVTQALTDVRHTQGELVRTEQLRGLGQMAAGIAHDLNNTLATVLGQTELAKLAHPAPDLQEALRLIEAAAADGAAVVKRLLDFARPKGAYPLEPCDLTAIVREVLELTRPRWKDESQRRGGSIAIDLAFDHLPPILGQPSELREALINLLFNAVDAMPTGGTIRLQGTVTAETVSVQIRDTGIGMPPEVCAKIFEPFFTTKDGKGTGLGLAIVYGTMERHGGSIGVVSVPMQGTTVTLTFRRALEAARVPRPSAAPAALQPPRRLLVVDDESALRQTTAALLRTAGHTVYDAGDGPSALAILAAAPVDVVCTDLGMPGMNGWDLARQIKAAHPALPILLLTGWQDHALGDDVDRKNVDVILGKPVKLPDLLRTIAALAHDAAETVDSEGRRRTAGAEGGLYLADGSKTKDSWGDCTTSRLSPMDTVTPG